MSNALQISSQGALGALVKNVDLAQVTDDQLQQLRLAFAEHEVLFFENQGMAPETHLAFAQLWGDININRFFTHVEGYPAIAQVIKEPEQQAILGVIGILIIPMINHPHWVRCYWPDRCRLRVVTPVRILLALTRAFPRVCGDVVIAAGRALIASRFGEQAPYVGQMEGRLGNSDAANQDAVHPVVIRHPLSSRPSLYVNPVYPAVRGLDG